MGNDWITYIWEPYLKKTDRSSQGYSSYVQQQESRIRAEFEEERLYFYGMLAKDIDDWKKYDYDIIRGILDKLFNPLGGYVFRAHHHMSYGQTISIIVPNGFNINQSETDLAWSNQTPSSFFLFNRTWMKNIASMGLLKGYVDLRKYRGKFPDLSISGGLATANSFFSNSKYDRVRGSVSPYEMMGVKYDSDKIFGRYLIIDSSNWVIGQPNYNRLVNSFIGDLGYARVGYTVTKQIQKAVYQNVTIWERGIDIMRQYSNIIDLARLDGMDIGRPTIEDYIPYPRNQIVEIKGGKVQQVRKSFLIGMFVSELMLFLDLMRRGSTATMYPVFMNMGFYKTIPAEIIKRNILLVIALVEKYFELNG